MNKVLTNKTDEVDIIRKENLNLLYFFVVVFIIWNWISWKNFNMEKKAANYIWYKLFYNQKHKLKICDLLIFLMIIIRKKIF